MPKIKDYFRTRFQAPLVDTSFVYDADNPDFVCPMDEELAKINYVDSKGHLVDVLSQVLHSTSVLERNKLLDLLEDNSTVSGSEFAQLDDETKLQLLKPRSIQSYAEMASYTDYVQNFFESNNSKPTELIKPTDPPQQTDPPQPTE